MTRIIAALFLLLSTVPYGIAQDVSSLTSVQEALPQGANYPLGLPLFVWWALGIWAGTFFGGWGLCKASHWFRERLDEPSTYLATAIMLACGGLFANSLYLDPSPLAQGMLLSATVYALLGLLGKDREGPLL